VTTDHCKGFEERTGGYRRFVLHLDMQTIVRSGYAAVMCGKGFAFPASSNIT
jgi:hypothetical protein